MSKPFGKKAWQKAISWDVSQIISAEIFGAERFKQHAHSLAQEQVISDSPPDVQSVIDRLSDNADALHRAYEDTLSAVARGKVITPAGEWLIDNYHLVEQHVSQTRLDLPYGFYRQLPKLAAGPLAGHPRIFGIAWAYVAHTDSRLDTKSLTEFINAYQEVQPLSIGELWAVAISLRLILIENLRRVADRIVFSGKARDAADSFSEIITKSETSATPIPEIIRQIGNPEVTAQFAVQLIQRLRDHNTHTVMTMDWLNAELVKGSDSLDQIVAEEHRRQGAANITIRNIVTSLRLISDVIWENWFDTVSLVDMLMRTNSTYGAMDFPSRTLYRTAIEELARGSNGDELDIAQRSLQVNGRDPGHYLIGAGRKTFEAMIGFKPPVLVKIRTAMRNAGLTGYLAGVGMFAVVALLAVSWPIVANGIATPLLLALVILGLWPAAEFAISLMNFIVTKVMHAQKLPGLSLRDGVPSHMRTIVVVPCLLTSLDDIDDLLQNLEIHYLSNTEGEVVYALLSDWVDCDVETMAADQELLQKAESGIAELNVRHGKERFFLLHRARKWNSVERKWMGWERKRGKLHELNRLLRGATDTSFINVSHILPEDIRYVITLDADTRLPRDAVRRLVGKLAHPLNVPRFDAERGRVVEGYGVLQPRVTPSLPVGHLGSVFQRIYSSTRGIDPYAFAVSDVYQDLFDEGSFAGKGIYDIDAFESALAGKVPENQMLSHDLFEGIFARAGLVSDIEVVEEYPERYAVAAARQHRWTRGDWQLLPWLVGRSSVSIPGLGVWKMFDNLRRSLTPVASIASLFCVWIFASLDVALVWTFFIGLSAFVPLFIQALTGALPGPQQNSLKTNASRFSEEVSNAALLVLANLVFLAHQSSLMADAIVRTVYRLSVSRKHLLEWTTAAQASANHKNSIAASYMAMPWSLIFAFLAVTVAAIRADGFWVLILPFALAWGAAPAIASWASISRQIEDTLTSSPDDRRSLRMVARRTWRFFDRFVNAEENMLPPDNFQEIPNEVVAHRTSPTNIGLYLLSIASAYELGWIGLKEAVSRIEATLKTVERLEKFQGHLYNWYDTQDLRPLDPKYISTVDSGNLAAHLIALSNCCQKWSMVPRDPAEMLAGIEDILDVLNEEMSGIPNNRRVWKPLRKQFDGHVANMRQSLRKALENPSTVPIKLVDFSLQAANIYGTVSKYAGAINTPQTAELLHWAQELRDTIESHFSDSSGLDDTLSNRLLKLAEDAKSVAMNMEFEFLFDPSRQLLSIGYRVHEAMRDESCYDMLASEARLASYFAIAKGDIRTRHWFKLGRSTTAVKGGSVLMSWSGSMFEYLMPSLVMRAPADGLLDQTTKLIVARQIEFGKQLSIPWGISESAFNARDIEYTYQYSNFGVPGLGLKRGLADNTVIAPYATGLAAMVAPRAAAANFALLNAQGGRGKFGFYEALDYTSVRVRKGESKAVVQAYFAHHQGMTIVAILNAVKNGEMRDRFHEEPACRATELLLQERVPRDGPIIHQQISQSVSKLSQEEAAPHPVRIQKGIPAGAPVTHILSNGQYSVMMTAAGSGQSTWNGISITRWREDPTKDDWGSFVYLRDLKQGTVWSSGYMPTAARGDSYQATFHEEKIEITRRDGPYVTTLECVVSAEDNAEARRVTVLNTGRTAREIEFTTYAELAMTTQATDIAHPAFAKLFVETEYIAATETLVATRRRRSSSDPEIWVAQFAVIEGDVRAAPEFETDRSRFVGIGNTARQPQAMERNGVLNNTVGNVLDPVFSLRYRLAIPAGRQVTFTLWTVVAATRDGVLDLIDRHRHVVAYERAQTLAWTQAHIQLRHMSMSFKDAQQFQILAGHLIYANAALRPTSQLLVQQLGPQSALWPLGISGDKPILLVRIDAAEDVDLIRKMLRAFEYLRSKGVVFDLVLLNDRMSSYVQDLQVAIEELVRSVATHSKANQIFIVRADLSPPDALRVLPAVARVVLYGRRGDLATQLSRLKTQPALAPRVSAVQPRAQEAVFNTDALEFFNGYGGFGKAGREYIVHASADKPTPAPWINVVANPTFGFHAAADGGGYSWFGNARDNQITPWSNDPVSNTPGEVFYIRDDVTGVLTSPTLSPLKSRQGTHIARHGFGYTVYERDVDDLHMELTQCVPLSDAVKLSRMKLQNLGKSSRTLTVTFYAEWVLGNARSSSAPFVTTTMDPTGAMLAQNRWKIEDNEAVAFADMAGVQSSWTGSRSEFLGAYGELAAPTALAKGSVLSNTTGAGLDPCCALQGNFKLAAGQTIEVLVVLGAAAHASQAKTLIETYRAVAFEDVLAEVEAFWDKTLNAVQVKTPDRAFDIMTNGWLLYQTLACRMWGRSGFYQASGAFGFRDQLQDAMSLLSTHPELSRSHILKAASRQFVEGDVQHWWLPNTGMGVRTRISDDTVWLVNCVCTYIKVTADRSILDEMVPFLEGQSLMPGEHDIFFLPRNAEEPASLYEHCLRALAVRRELGEHGLPLMGTGDWNDGMNRVGEAGKGESIWLAWFMLATLRDFSVIADERKDQVFLNDWKGFAQDLQDALESHGWDGRWYRRAFFDDGTALGSAANKECQIDSIAQSWAVLSGAAPPDRAKQALESSYEQLVQPEDKLVLLFKPPFNKTRRDPGYIKAYPPGIRENGGQYTHGVIWSIFAHAKLDQADRAFELYSIINPVNHALTTPDADVYKVEPYVVAADVYSIAPHTGRGGWTWYTGSAGWFYRAGVEGILGLNREGNAWRIKPVIPLSWHEVEVRLRVGSARYEITISRDAKTQHDYPDHVREVSKGEFVVTTADDGGTHQIKLFLHLAQ